MRKFGNPRKFGYDVAYTRTLFAEEGRESGVSPSGGGVCRDVINREMHLCNLLFSWREIAQEMAWLSSRGVCDRSAQFLGNRFEKIVMATNNSGLNSNYLLVRRATGKRKKRKA